MLQIIDIHKKYVTGELVQTALDGVSLTLRDNEFVAILGPSGSGKTTLLNVIGGLDRYDSGDLVINGISTRKYTDRDWDSYRNHTIGFVFQSYNLIPHQTVLANVELALTISGISPGERRKRATKALEDVGLGNQLHKRPNQMSGGQMQRVAIARALVNNPDILLADEPTGALDSDTSVQIMELLKEVAKDRLVVMVTHNPELAEEYANRIVRVRDGKIIGDTNPYAVAADLTPPMHKNMGKASMSFWTALALSFNNLRTKKARTILTAFAGSIGIIGIALIMSLSTGFQMYIDQIQEDTLSNYPLTISTETSDMSSLLSAYGSSMIQAMDAEEGVVVEQPMITQMFANVGTNDLASFKAYLEEHYDEVAHTVNDLRYKYGVKPLIYAENTSEKILQVNPGTLFGEISGSNAMSAYMDSDIFQELISNYELLDAQYEVLRGKWPEAYDEMVIVLMDPSQITDYMAYTLGLKDQDQLTALIASVMRGETVNPEDYADFEEWTYDDLMDLHFRLVPASQRYRYNEEYNVWEDMSGNAEYMRRIIANGVELKIVGIVCPREGVSTTVLTAGVAYRPELTQYVVDQAVDAQIVQAQLSDPAINVFSGQEFGAEDEESGLRFEDMITVDESALENAFGINIDTGAILTMLQNYMSDMGQMIQNITVPAQNAFMQGLTTMGTDMLNSYIGANGTDGSARIYLTDVEAMVDTYLAGENAGVAINNLVSQYGMTPEDYATVYRPLLIAMVTGYVSENMAMDSRTSSAGSGEMRITSEDGETTEPEETQPEETQPEETQPEETEPEETEPEETEPEETQPEETEPEETQPEETEPEETEPDLDAVAGYYASISSEDVSGIVSSFADSTIAGGTSAAMATRMTQASIYSAIQSKLAGFGSVLSSYFGSAFYVNEEALASMFQFDMSEEELMRLMNAMSGSGTESSFESNLRSLGYADLNKPTDIYIYLKDFEGKEEFLAFLDDYNDRMEESGQEDKVIGYTDVTGILMSSVRTIIDSVSYVLIAFVAVSLVVSSIMIGIITLISVQERTKEIGILRAIGASKRNISQVFNAETFIVGLCSGIIGVGMTLLLNIPINMIIHSLTDSADINAQLPAQNAVILVALSMVLTLIGGLIPSRKAAKKDPVIALRSE